MGRITRQEDASLSILFDLALMNMEALESDRVRDAYSVQAACLHHVLHILKRHLFSWSAWVRAVGGNDAEPTAAQGEESDQISPANKSHDPIIRSLPDDLHISQREVLLKGGSAKLHAQQVTHATMGPITTDEPARVYPRFAAVGAAQHRLHPVLLLSQIDQFHPALDRNALLVGQVFSQDSLGDVLRDEKRIGIEAVNEASEIEVSQLFLLAQDAETLRLVPPSQKSVRQANLFKEFKRACLYARRSRPGCCLLGLVDDATEHSVTG